MLVHIRLDKQMDEQIQLVVNKELFMTKSEFIRDAIRKSLEDYTLQQSINELTTLRGSAQEIPYTREQRKKNFLAFEKKSRDSQDKQ